MQRKTNVIAQPVENTDEIEYLIGQVAVLWRRLLNTNTQHLGITGTERRVLLSISCNMGLTQVAIAELLDLEPQNLMRVLDKLEARGYISKQANANDRRAKCLYVTEQGHKIIIKIKAVANQVRPNILASMSAQEITDFKQALAAIRENVVAELAGGKE